MNTSIIEEVRIKKVINKAQLCRLADISEPTYDNFIKQKKNTTIATVESVCKALSISPSLLFTENINVINEPLEPYITCPDCKRAKKQIDELMRTINNLNACVEKLTIKKSGSDVG
jgi:transcriptional regulator with XRE-family HTH domain